MNGYVKVYETPKNYVYSRRTYKKLKLLQEGKNTIGTTGKDNLGDNLLYYDAEYLSGGAATAKYGIKSITLKDGATILQVVTISDQYVISNKLVNIFYIPSYYPATQPATIDNVDISYATKTLSTAINKTEQIGLLFEWEITITG